MRPPSEESPPNDLPSLLGVDGGGTRTRAVRLEKGETTSELVAEATNPLTVGLDVASRRLISLLERASPGGSPAAIGIGIAGVGASRAARDHLSQKVSERFPESKVLVTTDVVCALAGAFDGEAGILVVGGTGSVAVGYAGTRACRAGGWGRRLGDQGSGFDLFRQAVRVGLAHADGLEIDGMDVGGASTDALTRSLTTALDLESPSDLIALFARDPEPDELVRAVDAIVRQAELGDRCARALLETQGRQLARLALAVARRLDAPLPVSTIGGLLQGARIVREAFAASLTANGLVVQQPVHAAEVGAAWLAATLVGHDVGNYGQLLAASEGLLR